MSAGPQEGEKGTSKGARTCQLHGKSKIVDGRWMPVASSTHDVDQVRQRGGHQHRAERREGRGTCSAGGAIAQVKAPAKPKLHAVPPPLSPCDAVLVPAAPTTMVSFRHRLSARTQPSRFGLSLFCPYPSIPLCPGPRRRRLRQASPSIRVGTTSVAAAAAAFGRQESHPQDNERGAAEPQRRQTLPKHNPAGDALRHRKPKRKKRKYENCQGRLARHWYEQKHERNCAVAWRERERESKPKRR